MTLSAGIFRTKLPLGFLAGGINSGVRRYRPDVGVIFSEEPCVAVGVFTQNTCKAAPVKYCEEILPSKEIKAIITNSGEANAATGPMGIENNKMMAQALAEIIGCNGNQVLTASTGVIGEQLSLGKIIGVMPALVKSCSDIAEKFALSILTTDLVPKAAYKEVELSQGKVRITGICKGSGMIHPNMATMLGYLLTDAVLTIPESQKLIKDVCDTSFNMISVDGETSTNDCVLMLANGLSRVTLHTAEDYQIFHQALESIAITLAKSIARDGEGATKLVEVNVKGLKDLTQAKRIARSITVSPLIKTAIYGESPNWGRILARIGAEQVAEEMFNHCSILIQGIKVFSGGCRTDFDLPELRRKIKEDTTQVVIDFNQGDYSATAWGCDLTEKYVEINAGYVT